ncbi:metal-dependent hydrolase [Haloplanus rubicundus]|uniref:Metal-dependent hydrolase n=1 Tax=Haloplanus rubicundus TaxID=1547898 RepID=A0A345E4C9_9EURY|nr:metal-dependent hydrolase [Haloplanus rubicundus]AXG07051.1 metal-dependent hydrolase [Haloplanus rubicundus]AXG10420.1 metal-dependent hydrolase [Haloplanus rubicundus]
MADLLTHVLTAYVLAALLSLRDDRITPAMVTAAMVGGLVPDLNRIGLVVPASAVESLLGVPFDWDALLTVGGVSVVLGLGTLLVPPRLRRRTAAMLALGTLSHFLLDYLLLFPSGYSHPYLWPMTAAGLPGPELYLSSARWPAVVAAACAALAWLANRRQKRVGWVSDGRN